MKFESWQCRVAPRRGELLNALARTHIKAFTGPNMPKATSDEARAPHREGPHPLSPEAVQALNRLSNGATRWDGIPSLDRPLDLEEVEAACSDGTPLEYVLGRAPFMGRVFRADRRALIPRAETELLGTVTLELARSLGRGPLTIMDIGTGCGNLAITLALELEGCCVYASDVSSEALELARVNVGDHGCKGRVVLGQGSLYDPFEGEAIEGSVDLIVCNPPYIPTRSLEAMDSGIRDYEPREAFDGGSFGLEVVRGLVDGTERFLRPGGALVFEFGVGQHALMARLLRQRPHLEKVEMYSNEEGVDRVLSARRV